MVSQTAYLVVILIFNFPKESDIFDQSGFDVLVIHELAEDIKFLSQKLVCEIYLKKSRKKYSMKKTDAPR